MILRSAFVFLLLALHSQLLAQTFTSATHAGGTANDYGTRVAIDREENVYVLGEFSGQAFFDSVSLIDPGPWSIFLTKYDPHGHVIWAKLAASVVGAQSDVIANGLAIDSAGDILIGGWFRSQARIGDSSLVSNGVSDIFLEKYSGSGQLLWTRQSGGVGRGSYGQDVLANIAVDRVGNCYLVGNYNSDARFGDDSIASANTDEVFVAKYDRDGNAQWAATGGERGSAHLGLGIAVDASGECYITGAFFNKLSLGHDTLDAVDAEKKMFVAKLDAKGGFVWAHKIGDGGYYGSSQDIALDGHGALYLAGFFRASMSIGGNNFSYDYGYHYAMLITKYDTAGALVWVRRSEGPNHQSTPQKLLVDDHGEIYVTGSFLGSPSYAGKTLTETTGAGSAFIVKLDPTGTFLFAKAIFAKGSASGRALAKLGSGDVVVVGSFDTAVNFDSIHITSSGASDAFIARLSERIAWVSPGKKSVSNSLYPNPVSRSIFLPKGTARGLATVLDAGGKIVLEAASQRSVDVSGLPAGVYYLLYENQMLKFEKVDS